MQNFGYIDPSTGSLFIQVAVGGFLATIVVFRKYISSALSKIKLVFYRRTVTVIDEED